MDDPLDRLRPPSATPDDEICSCGPGIPIKLMCVLSYNPICCVGCNLERAPATLGLDEMLVQEIAYWRGIYDGIYLMWLDSAEYEEWARAQLVDLSSPVNRRGRALRANLDRLTRCYYWLFEDVSADDYMPLAECPSCGGAWDACIYRPGHRVCEPCSLVTA
jgi:predicted  nucleic acid-binding Zn ribbon protein